VTGTDASHVHLRVQTPERVLFDGPVAWVQVPLEDGLLGVWPEHASLVAAVTEGAVSYAGVAGEASLSVSAGVLLIDEGRCVVLFSAPTDSPEEDRDIESLADGLTTALEDSLSEDEIDGLQEPWE
jgi:F0F1-type ATP synthase epsilon subunit